MYYFTNTEQLDIARQTKKHIFSLHSTKFLLILDSHANPYKRSLKNDGGYDGRL